MDQTSKEYLSLHGQEIGRVVVSVGIFDNDLNDMISQSLRLNLLQENALLRPLSSRAKADLLTRLGRLFLTPDDMSKVTKWCEGAKKALEERNNLIHGSPGHIDGKVVFRSFSGKNKLNGKPEEWPIEKVAALAARFNNLTRDLEETVLPLFKPTFLDEALNEGDGSTSA